MTSQQIGIRLKTPPDWQNSSGVFYCSDCKKNITFFYVIGDKRAHVLSDGKRLPHNISEKQWTTKNLKRQKSAVPVDVSIFKFLRSIRFI